MTAVRTTALPSAWRIGLSRGGLEIRQVSREKEALFFTFALPIVLLLIFGSIFDFDIDGTGIPFRQYFVAGIIASGIMSTAFVGLGTGITNDRDDGTLKRLAGLPMPKSAYFIGKVVMVALGSLIETAVLLVIGSLAYGLTLPADPARWLTFAWVFLLGVTACALLGVAISALPRSARTASAVTTLPYICLQFISGVFFPFGQLPGFLRTIAAFFPLKWLCQGLRSVFLPDGVLAVEPAHGWEHGRTALVLIAWCAGGLVLCMTTFRWTRRGEE
ncbi:MAG TPA: ABC transporter permease [Streptosporangiaceae bacterium]|jgi:ABC-2 type transport system permease protein